MSKKKLRAASELTWKDLEVGNIVKEPGSAGARRTGDWRTQRPILDKKKCIKCALCWLNCPDVAIKPPDKEGYYVADLDYCKGCGICAEICPVDAITMTEEEEE
jgi:pyruvate ferredoxin oxidoreductase delta subunit